MAEEPVMEEMNSTEEETPVEESPETVAETEVTDTGAAGEETGEAAETEATQEPAEDGRRIADLAPKMQIKGVVQSVELYGALIDIGAERPGLLHISQISDDPVRDVSEHVQEGDTLELYILEMDPEAGRVTLTLKQPPAMTWNEMEVGDVVKATIVRIEKYGAFADIGAERPGLIHVSELANDYVGSPNTVVNVGDVVDARIIGVDRRKKQIDLSIRALEADTVVENEEEEGEEMTAMAMALRQAFADAEAKDARNKKRKKKDKRRNRDEQSDIIARTLNYHDDN